MRPLSVQTRLWLGQVTVLAAMLALAAFGADWALGRVLLGRVDEEILSFATTEKAALEDSPSTPLRVLESAPGPPSFVRLDKLVQITDLEGHVAARSSTLGSAHLPTSPDLLAHLRAGETVFRTVADFGDEPIRMVVDACRRSAKTTTRSRWRCPSTMRMPRFASAAGSFSACPW